MCACVCLSVRLFGGSRNAPLCPAQCGDAAGALPGARVLSVGPVDGEGSEPSARSPMSPGGPPSPFSLSHRGSSSQSPPWGPSKGGGSPRGHPRPLSPRGVQSPSPTGMYSPPQLRAQSAHRTRGAALAPSAGKGGRRCLAHPPMGAVWVILSAPTPGGILPGSSALATPGERVGGGEQGRQPLPLSALGPSSSEVPSVHLSSSPPADTLLDPLPSWGRISPAHVPRGEEGRGLR